MLTQLRFVSLGFENAVCANKVYMVTTPFTAQGGRILKAAKEEGRYIDISHRRPVKALVIMDDNRVLGCAFSPKTTLNRIVSACEDMTEDDADDDDEY